jgi:flavin reductase (DIM6/NTAB) family NADH-FMN oxidoreductase RutF
VVNGVPAGDLTIVVLEVHAVEAHPEIAPLVFHASRFHSLDRSA